jgi:hypothetical protein
MKKVFVVLAACSIVFASTNAGAQTLKDVLKRASATAAQSTSSSVSNAVYDVISSVAGTTTKVSLPGTWKYIGVAVSFQSENALSKVAAASLAKSVQKKVDRYLQMVGIKSGQMTYTFNSDGTFTTVVKTALKTFNLNGNYTTKDNGKAITLKYGKTLQYLSMTGILTGTTKGCAMLFNADSFLSFLKKMGTVMGNTSAGAAASGISALASTYDGMKIGFEFSK